MLVENPLHHDRHFVGGDSGVDGLSEAANGAAALAQEPLQERTVPGELATDDRGSQRQCVVGADLAKEFALAVEILGIRAVRLPIVAAAAAEHAIGADVNQPGTPEGHPLAEPVRQERADRQARDQGAEDFGVLLDDAAQ